MILLNKSRKKDYVQEFRDVKGDLWCNRRRICKTIQYKINSSLINTKEEPGFSKKGSSYNELKF